MRSLIVSSAGGMADRLRLWLHAFLVALDQWVYVVLAAPKYILAGGQPPNPRETISSKVGRAALAGKRWARIAEKLIDRLFVLLGERSGHCARSIIDF